MPRDTELCCSYNGLPVDSAGAVLLNGKSTSSGVPDKKAAL